MQPSKSIEDLDMSIQELDGMYQDLRRRSVKLDLAAAKIMDEDADYDIPRPAQGIINKVSTPYAEPMKSKRFHSVSQLESTIPRLSSGDSDYSSGFGTLPNRNIMQRAPLDYEFTPIFEPQPPPFPVSDSDSDYDEPKSHILDIYNNPVPTRRRYSATSSDYAEPKSRSSDAAIYDSPMPVRKRLSTTSLDYDEPKSRSSDNDIHPMLLRSKSSSSSLEYDEPKSRSSYTEIYNYPISTRRKSSTCSTDYDEPKLRSLEAEVHSSPIPVSRRSSDVSSVCEDVKKHPPVANNQLKVTTTIEMDYAEVFDVPTPRKNTDNSDQLSQVLETDESIPATVVVEVDIIEKNEDPEDEASQLDDLHISTTDLERNETPVAIVVDEVRANDVIDERTFPAALTSNSREIERRFTFSKRGTSKIQKDRYTQANSKKNVLVRIMDAGSRRLKSGSKGPECPCRCRIAVPLMSAAIIICAAIFIVMVAGYVYIGIKTDEHLAESGFNSRNIFNSTNEVTGSGDAI